MQSQISSSVTPVTQHYQKTYLPCAITTHATPFCALTHRYEMKLTEPTCMTRYQKRRWIDSARETEGDVKWLGKTALSLLHG